MAFVQRRIQVTFILGKGAFGEEGETVVKVSDVPTFGMAQEPNTLSIGGLRVRAHIREIGSGGALAEAEVEVWGLTNAQMQQLSALQQYTMWQRNNRVVIQAGDYKEGMAAIYEGQINACWVNYDAQPDSSLHLTATVASKYLFKPALPSSFPGSADAAVIMDGLAREMNLKLENNGVQVMLATPYYPGTLIDQARKVAEDAGFDWYIAQNEGKLVITPYGKTRGGLVPLISPATGMIGYPVHDSATVIVNNLFNRNIKILGKVKVESSVLNALGEWRVIAVSHDLESETHGGEWFTRFQASRLEQPHVQPTMK